MISVKRLERLKALLESKLGHLKSEFLPMTFKAIVIFYGVLGKHVSFYVHRNMEKKSSYLELETTGKKPYRELRNKNILKRTNARIK